MIGEGIAAVSTLLLVAVGWVIGLRLLLLARRTRGIPELTIGIGVLLIGGFAYPLAVAGNVLLESMPVTAGTFLVASATVSHIGLAAHGVFTWKVFRPGVRWAAFLVGCSAAGVAIGFAGNLHVVVTGLDPDLGNAKPWTLFLMAVAVLAFAWSGAESLAYHAKLRRRLALGMGDPVVANRFLLWGISSSASSVGCVVNAWFTVTSPLSVLDPVALLVCGLCSALSAVVMTLTFLPPARYVRFIEARHAAAAH